ncbi:metallophosphoesterase [Nisaea sp.]|uniref:metallophosphoesterase n=1 Tax=Nisaea sp. TaxID=2024842 RepID=UPI003267C681
MVKIVWLSDLHFVTQGDVQGHDPRSRMRALVDFVNRHYRDCSFCIISGDLADRATAPDYAHLAEFLAQIEMPVFPMVGNHDNRDLVRSNLLLPKNCMAEFIQFSIPTPDGLMVCLDTQKAGSDAGEFCAERTSWLKGVLEAAKGTSVYLFMHHPPMRLGLPMLDPDNMQDGDAFLDFVSAFPEVKHLLMGHVHRPIAGTVRGIPFASMRAVLYQAPPPVPAWDWDSFTPSREAPNLGIITIENGDLNLQYMQFCEYSLGAPMTSLPEPHPGQMEE